METRFYLALIILFSSLVGCATPGFDLSSEPVDSADHTISHDTITICSFNIQFLGHFKDREDSLLGYLLKDYDVVVIQEMVAPPVDGSYRDGIRYSLDEESKRFHTVMTGNGFKYWLSEEDTGPSKNRTSSSASEWWVLYYNDKIMPDTLIEPHGFLSDTLVGNQAFQRVPYSFALKTSDGSTSFNLISVHLNPGGSSADKTLRQVEFSGIYNWIATNRTANKDFIVLGDCNIENREELSSVEKSALKEEYHSLNSNCQSTNTKLYEAAEKGKPYDHIFINEFCSEDVIENTFRVVDLKESLTVLGREEEFFPYEHNYFRTRISDHVPVIFQIVTGKDTD